MLRRLFCSADPFQRGGERVSRLAVGGGHLSRAPEDVHRIGMPARIQMDLPDAGVGLRVPWIDEECRDELGQRLAGAVLLHERDGQESVHRRVIGICAHGAREGVDGSRKVGRARRESSDGCMNLTVPGYRAGCGALEFLSRFGISVDVLIGRRQPPVRER